MILKKAIDIEELWRIPRESGDDPPGWGTRVGV